MYLTCNCQRFLQESFLLYTVKCTIKHEHEEEKYLKWLVTVFFINPYNQIKRVKSMLRVIPLYFKWKDVQFVCNLITITWPFISWMTWNSFLLNHVAVAER